jgi:hypothetical protein
MNRTGRMRCLDGSVRFTPPGFRGRHSEDRIHAWVQMLGRGTRLCPEIHKTHFTIFDCFICRRAPPLSCIA